MSQLLHYFASQIPQVQEQGPETVRAVLQYLKDFLPAAGVQARLDPNEKLMILNYMPKTLLDLSILITDVDSRFTDDELNQILAHLNSIMYN
jgi:hypothetical protein